MKNRNARRWSLVLAAASLAVALHVSAADPASDPSKEQREKMALVHEQMAQCLRSDKTFAECREQMWTGCSKLGAQGCPMMGMHRGMMRPGAPQPSAPQPGGSR